MLAAKLSSKSGNHMSRIGKSPIKIPSSVQFELADRVVSVDGPKGHLKMRLPDHVEIKREAEIVNVAISKPEHANLHGLTRTLIQNMVTGVVDNWTRILELNGTGFRATTNGSDLQLALGFSHPVTIKAPEGISFEVKETKITVRGADKSLVGEIAAKIRALKPADPYKAKGFKYDNEVIVRKAGKAAKAGA